MTETMPDEPTPGMDDAAEPIPPETEGPEADPAEAGDDELGAGVAHTDSMAPPDYEQPGGVTFDPAPEPEQPGEGEGETMTEEEEVSDGAEA